MSVNTKVVLSAIFPDVYTYDPDYDELESKEKINILSYPFNIRRLFYDIYDETLDKSKSKLTLSELNTAMNNDKDLLFVNNPTDNKLNINIVYNHFIKDDYKYFNAELKHKRHMNMKYIVCYDKDFINKSLNKQYESNVFNINIYLDMDIYPEKSTYYNNDIFKVISYDNMFKYMHILLFEKQMLKIDIPYTIIYDRFIKSNNDLIMFIKRVYEYLNNIYDKTMCAMFELYTKNNINKIFIEFPNEVTDYVLKITDSFMMYRVINSILGYYNTFENISDNMICFMFNVVKAVKQNYEESFFDANGTFVYYCYSIVIKYSNNVDDLIDITKLLVSKYSNISTLRYDNIKNTISEYINASVNNKKNTLYSSVINNIINSDQLLLSPIYYKYLDDVFNINMLDKYLTNSEGKYNETIIKWCIDNNAVDKYFEYVNNNITTNKDIVLTEAYAALIDNCYDKEYIKNRIINDRDIDYKTKHIYNDMNDSLASRWIKSYKEEPFFEIYPSPLFVNLAKLWKTMFSTEPPKEMTNTRFYNYMLVNKGEKRPANITAMYTYFSNSVENKIIFIDNDNLLENEAELRYIIPVAYKHVKKFVTEEIDTNNICLFTKISNKDWEKIAGGNDRIDVVAFSDCKDVWRNRTPLTQLITFFKDAIELKFDIQLISASKYEEENNKEEIQATTVQETQADEKSDEIDYVYD